jgi:hypothetical protein
MFPSQDTPPLARRLLGGLRLIRSFLLLEDDYDVDWEVDRDELEMVGRDLREEAWEESEEDHPHRFALRIRLGSRRPGVPAPREQVCLCPLPSRVRRTERDRSTMVSWNDHEPPDRAARVS